MHTLTLNGAAHDVAPGSRLIDLIAEVTTRSLNTDGTPEDGGRLGVAVAVDATVVPRSQWHATELTDGQNVEIITAMQGG
ncbi:sulfur carrier protein ThiS [Brevibacterium yomogidense]|uniref:sulfur carrier protein ThiS n=1 Tax=Brevibacterium yomogidense TaxID=946573 RepID=UPI0018DFCC56